MSTSKNFVFFINVVLNMLLKYLSLSNDAIIKFKQNKTSKDVEERGQNLILIFRIFIILYY